MNLDFTLPDSFEADASGNQHESIVAALQPVIDFTRHELQVGTRLSEIARRANEQSVGFPLFFSVLRQVTDAEIPDIKALRQWWDDEGITDREAFDAWAVSKKINVPTRKKKG